MDKPVSAYKRMNMKEREKMDKYLDIARELKVWNMRMTVIPISCCT